jgi:hypothetical protein
MAPELAAMRSIAARVWFLTIYSKITGGGGATLGKLWTMLQTVVPRFFELHTVAELTYDLWLQAINKTGARSRFFERLRSITVFLLFSDWQNLMTTLAFARPPSQPP